MDEIPDIPEDITGLPHDATPEVLAIAEWLAKESGYVSLRESPETERNWFIRMARLLAEAARAIEENLSKTRRMLGEGEIRTAYMQGYEDGARMALQRMSRAMIDHILSETKP